MIVEPFHTWPSNTKPSQDASTSSPATGPTQAQLDSWTAAFADADAGSLTPVNSSPNQPDSNPPADPPTNDDIVENVFGDTDVGTPDVVENWQTDEGTWFRYDINDQPITTVSHEFIFDDLDQFNNAANSSPPSTALTFEGVTYETDNLGRIALVFGTPQWNERSRTSLQTEIGREGDEFDVGFHVAPHNAGTPTNRLTIVPGNGVPIPGDTSSNLNQGDYARLFESHLREMREQSPEIEIRVNYDPDNASSRPDGFSPVFSAGGQTYSPGVFEDSYYGSDGAAFDNKTIEHRYYSDPYGDGFVEDSSASVLVNPADSTVGTIETIETIETIGTDRTDRTDRSDYFDNDPLDTADTADLRTDTIDVSVGDPRARARSIDVDGNVAGVFYERSGVITDNVGEIRYEGEHGSASLSGPGYELTGETSLTFDDGRVNANVEFAAAVYLANAEFEASYGPAAINGQAYVGASLEGDASLNFDPLNGDVAAEFGGEVFVGGKAETEASVSISDNADVAVGGAVSYGIGGEFDAHAGFEDGVIDIEFDIGATLGVGVDLSFDIEVDVMETAGDVGGAIKDGGGAIVDLGGKIGGKIGGWLS